MDQRNVFRVCLLLSCLAPLLTGSSANSTNVEVTSVEISTSSSATTPGSTPSDLYTTNSMESAGTQSTGHPSTITIRKMTNPSTKVCPTVVPIPVTKDECLFGRKEGSILLTVTGGLVVLSTTLMVVSVVLACQLCHQNRRVPVSQGNGSRHVRSNVDLVSNTALWGTAQRNKDAEPEAEASETSVLMKELEQTRKEMVKISMDGEGKDKEQKRDEGGKEKPKEEETDENKANGDQGQAGGSKKENLTQPADPVVEPSTKVG